MVSVARFIELYLGRYYSAKLGFYILVSFYLPWVAVCQPFVKWIYDEIGIIIRTTLKYD